MLNRIKIYVYNLIHGRLSVIYRALTDSNSNLLYNQNVLKNTKTGTHTKLHPPYKATESSIGSYTYIAENSKVHNTTIGKFCSVGPNLISGWGIHPLNGISSHPMFYSTMKQNGMTLSETNKVEETKPIVIGNDVFIGMNVCVLDGVTIGHGAAIGAGAVVSKDIPPYAIAVGCPIKVVGYRFDEATIQRLLEIKWWDNEEQLHDVERNLFNVEEWIKKQS